MRRSRRVLLGARTEEDMLQRSEIGLLQERLNLTVVDVVEQLPEQGPGDEGRIDLDLLDSRLPSRSRHHLEYFLCGPPMMVRSVGQHLRALGISARRIHTERFEVV